MIDHGWLLTHLPFAALATNSPPPNRPLLTRLAEQAVVGIVAAGIGIYVNDIRQQGQIESLNMRVAELSHKIDEMRRDLYVPRTSK